MTPQPKFQRGDRAYCTNAKCSDTLVAGHVYYVFDVVDFPHNGSQGLTLFGPPNHVLTFSSDRFDRMRPASLLK